MALELALRATLDEVGPIVADLIRTIPDPKFRLAEKLLQAIHELPPAHIPTPPLPLQSMIPFSYPPNYSKRYIAALAGLQWHARDFKKLVDTLRYRAEMIHGFREAMSQPPKLSRWSTFEHIELENCVRYFRTFAGAPANFAAQWAIEKELEKLDEVLLREFGDVFERVHYAFVDLPHSANVQGTVLLAKWRQEHDGMQELYKVAVANKDRPDIVAAEQKSVCLELKQLFDRYEDDIVALVERQHQQCYDLTEWVRTVVAKFWTVQLGVMLLDHQAATKRRRDGEFADSDEPDVPEANQRRTRKHKGKKAGRKAK
jgi:hypothetical protein